MTADWPTEAREAAREAFERTLVARLAERDQSMYLSGGGWRVELHVQAGDDDMGPLMDAVLHALSPHVHPRTDDSACQCVVDRLAVLHDGHCCVVTPGSVELTCHQSEVDAYRNLAEAREVLGEIGELVDPWMGFDGATVDGVKAVIAEVKRLRAVNEPRTDDWEWGVHVPHLDYLGYEPRLCHGEDEARRRAQGYPDQPANAVRRRPAGEWEVAQ